MKKVMLGLSLMISLLAYSGNDSIYVMSVPDEMTDRTYYMVNEFLIVANEEKTVGFKIEPYLKVPTDMEHVIVTMVNIGGCNENDEMIILFENGEKITKKSWKKFNCKGKAYFSFTDEDKKLLSSVPVLKIRITNGRDYKSYTGNVEDTRYFVKLFESMNR